MDKVRLRNHELTLVDKETVQITVGKLVFFHRSVYAQRLIEVADLQNQDQMSRRKPHYCDCYVMAAYLQGVDDHLRWAHHTEHDYHTRKKYPGIEIQDCMRDAVEKLELPIGLFIFGHAATLIDVDADMNTLVAQKVGSGPFELTTLEEFLLYKASHSNPLPAKNVIFKGNEKENTT